MQSLPEILRWFAGRVFDPTRHWPPSGVSRLVFDQATLSLNGVHLGAPLAAFRPLGPADRITGRPSCRHFIYHRLGLEITCAKGRIDELRFTLAPTGPPDDAAQHLTEATLTLITLDGATHVLSCATTEDDVIALFGYPHSYGEPLDHTYQSFLFQGSSALPTHDSPLLLPGFTAFSRQGRPFPAPRAACYVIARYNPSTHRLVELYLSHTLNYEFPPAAQHEGGAG